MKEIPIYLFTGFLEAGKTKVIQETLEDEAFNTDEQTLIISCEEGLEEYDISSFSGSYYLDEATVTYYNGDTTEKWVIYTYDDYTLPISEYTHPPPLLRWTTSTP